MGSLGSGEQQFILCLEESHYASRNTFLTNTSRSEGGTGGGSKSEAGAEPEELPEAQQPVTFNTKHGLPTLPDYGMEELPEAEQPITFKTKHGLPTLPDCGVEVFPEDY